MGSFFERLRRYRTTTSTESTYSVALREAADSEALLRERLAELELALEDDGWRRILGGDENEFSREGLRKIMALSRLMFLKNPLIQRAVQIQAVYVWGQGVSITSNDEATQAAIDAFLKEPGNVASFTGHQARTMADQDLQVFGNLFIALFPHVSTGIPSVRMISPTEIQDIITNPEDKTEPWFYLRTWTQSGLNWQTGISTPTTHTAYYPSLHYSQIADERIPVIGNHPVMWDSPVYHVRVGGLTDMRFGVPETYAALDWAKAYKSHLEDWASVTRALARFAFKLETKGGAKGISAAKTVFGTTLGTSGSTETNPAPVVGSTFISSGGADLTPIRTAGVTTSAEDGRRLLLMVAAAMGLPETFFGDVQTGNLATAKSLDRPTELKFRDRRELWKATYEAILRYVVAASSMAPNGALRMARSGGEHAINIVFPPILEHDVTQSVAAIVSAATLDGKALAGTLDLETVTRLVCEVLEIKNVDEIIARVEAEQAAKQDAAPPDAQVPAPVVAEAFRAIREAVRGGSK